MNGGEEALKACRECSQGLLVLDRISQPSEGFSKDLGHEVYVIFNNQSPGPI